MESSTTGGGIGGFTREVWAMIRLSAQFEGFTGVLSMKGVDSYQQALNTAEEHMPVIENAKKVTLERV